MNHLTDEQISDWLAGEAGSEVEQHLHSCAECQSELYGLRHQISRYSLQMRLQADVAQQKRLARISAPARAIAAHRLRWSAATALAIVLVAQTAWLLRPHPKPAEPVQSAAVAPQPAAAMSDDDLLEAVNNDLSRDVPQALAPVGAITVARNKMASTANSSTKEGDRE